jgi:hypothetical protein
MSGILAHLKTLGASPKLVMQAEYIISDIV